MDGNSVQKSWELNVSQFRKVVLWYKRSKNIELLTFKIFNTGKCENKMSLTISEALQIPIRDILDLNHTKQITISNGRRILEIRVLQDDTEVELSLSRFVSDIWIKRILKLYRNELVVLDSLLQDIINRNVDYLITRNNPSCSSVPDLLDDTILDAMDIS